MLIASTFNDYYVFSYWGGGKYGDDRWVPGIGVLFGMHLERGGDRRQPRHRDRLARRRANALAAARGRQREAGATDPRFALLLMPLGALLGQLHFATKYPNDNFGPIKGAYLQFVAPVLCALFGVGVDWMWRRRARWALGRGGARRDGGRAVHRRLLGRAPACPRFGQDANTAAPFFAQPRQLTIVSPPCRSPSQSSDS